MGLIKEQEQLTERQKEAIQQIRSRYNAKDIKFCRNMLCSMVVAALIWSGNHFSGSPLSKLNPHLNNPVIRQYSDVLEKQSEIEQSITYLQKQISNIDTNKNLPYQPDELKDSIEQVFVDSSRINTLEGLAQQYQSHLEQTNEQVKELRETPECEKYSNFNNLLEYSPLALFSLFTIGLFAGSPVINVIKKRKISKVKGI